MNTVTYIALVEYRAKMGREFEAGLAKIKTLKCDDQKAICLWNTLNRAEECHAAHKELGIDGLNPDCFMEDEMIAQIRAGIEARVRAAEERFEGEIESKVAAREHEMMYGND